MKNYDSVIIGHITEDHNIDHLDNEVHICGGAVLFSSASAHALGHKVAAITRLAKKDENRLSQFTVPAEDVYPIFCENSTTIRNKYFTADKERRECRCLSLGDSFKTEDVPDDVCGKIYHLAGLIYGDFSSETVKQVSKKGAVAVDVQGFLRHWNPEDKSMFFEDWADKKEVLPYITYLKTDAAEAEILTGLDDRKEAAKLLHSWGAKEVVITHNTEVLAFDGNEFYTCPIRARNLSGRTGRGDTTFAAYLNERRTHSVKDALLTATATVSYKMETPGALRATRADIENYIKEFYADIK